MNEIGAGQNDHGAGSHLESEDWAVNLADVFNVFEEMLARTSNLEEVSDDRPATGSRREVESRLRGAFLDEEEDECRDYEGHNREEKSQVVIGERGRRHC